MQAIQLIQEGFEHLHVALREDMAEVEPEWLWWQPQPEHNHIGFLLWHLVRDEDQVVSWLAREPQLWTSAGWHERFGMDVDEQGTGMDASRLESFRYEMPAFMEYAEAVWSRTGPLLATLTDDQLEKPAWKDSPWNIGRQLVEGVLCHGWVHLGEIRSLMGLKGWRFRE